VYNCQGTNKKLRIIPEFELYKFELNKFDLFLFKVQNAESNEETEIQEMLRKVGKMIRSEKAD
jgi:hypothetical protein